MTTTTPAVSGVTLLICTYNGEQRLAETLRNLAAQQVPAGLSWELLLVSNASTDDTLAAAERIWAELGNPVPLRTLEEPKPGKENALIRGFDEANYENMCIVDDDNWLYPNYVGLVAEIMNAHPQIGILGAFAEGTFEVPPPTWFERFQAVYAVGAQAAQAGPLTGPDGYLYGAGSVVRKSAWLKLLDHGFRFTTSAKRGKVLSGAEDVELGDALKLAGYELWYDPRLRLRHFMYKERLTWEYLCRIGQGTASSGLTSLVYHFLHREPALDLSTFRTRYLRWLAWMGKEVVLRPGELLTYRLHGHDENYPDTFETLRRVYRLRMGLTRRADAEQIFLQAKELQRRLQANPAPIASV